MSWGGTALFILQTVLAGILAAALLVLGALLTVPW